MEQWARIELLESGRPTLIEGEVEVTMVKGVALKNEFRLSHLAHFSPFVLVSF